MLYSMLAMGKGEDPRVRKAVDHILALVDRDDNEFGTNAKFLVRFNDIQFANQIAGTTE